MLRTVLMSIIVAVAMYALPQSLPSMAGVAFAQTTNDLGGTYSVHGTNPNGSTYTGTVVVKPDKGRYHFSWLIANGDTYRGTGTRSGKTLVVPFGGKYPVVYEVGADGVLHGKWENGRASETLVPKR